MTKFNPIFGFAGQASQAMDLYAKAFDAKITTKLTYAQANPKDFTCNTGEENLIYYAEIKIGKQLISMGDDFEAVRGGVQPNTGNAFRIDLLVHFDTDEALKTAHDLLAEGGTVLTPLCSQTYCSLTSAVVDKYGGRWQLMSGYKG